MFHSGPATATEIIRLKQPNNTLLFLLIVLLANNDFGVRHREEREVDFK